VAGRAWRRAGWMVVRIWEHELQRGKHSTFNLQPSTSNRRKKAAASSQKSVISSRKPESSRLVQRLKSFLKNKEQF
jgi:hypothetical protein